MSFWPQRRKQGRAGEEKPIQEQNLIKERQLGELEKRGLEIHVAFCSSTELGIEGGPIGLERKSLRVEKRQSGVVLRVAITFTGSH